MKGKKENGKQIHGWVGPWPIPRNVFIGADALPAPANNYFVAVKSRSTCYIFSANTISTAPKNHFCHIETWGRNKKKIQKKLKWEKEKCKVKLMKNKKVKKGKKVGSKR